MNYSKHLILYSGGADSTFFIENEPTATHLIHYSGLNTDQTKIAVINANILNRYITVESLTGDSPTKDGETNAIHALYDTQMAITAGIKAQSFGMKGIVLCFNRDDIGINVKAVTAILQSTDPAFEVLEPLRKTTAKAIRSKLKASNSKLKTVSCMFSTDCGFCAKCKRGY